MKAAQFIHLGLRYCIFWCPGCEHIHQVNDQWDISPEDQPLTLSPSVLVRSGPIPPDPGNPELRCHSFVKAGRIEFLNDSTHPMAGQTAELPDLPEVWVKDAEDHDERRCHPEKHIHANPHRGCILR